MPKHLHAALRDLRAVLGFARIEQLPQYVRRAARLPVAQARDFLPGIAEPDGQRLQQIAVRIRGAEAPPAIFIHGVLPRSGTNFLSDILALHPDLQQNPGGIWEFPVLSMASSVAALQREFIFRANAGEDLTGQLEMLGYLASGWLRKLQEEAGGRRLLLKSPHVQNIGLFRHVFPNDKLLLCLRDGRDVVKSSRNSFLGNLKNKSFAQLATEWKDGCEAMLTFAEGGENAHPNAKVVRYENLVRDPKASVTEILAHCGLDAARYDFDALARLPVRGSSTYKVDNENRWVPQAKRSDFNPIGRWQSWSARNQAIFKKIAGDTLVRAEYENGVDW